MPSGTGPSSSKKEVYQRWKDSSVTLTFPFAFKDKGMNIKHTWEDVKYGMQKDGQNPTLHRTTAHFTPTTLQSELVKQEIHWENNSLTPRSSGRELETQISAATAAAMASPLKTMQSPYASKASPRRQIASPRKLGSLNAELSGSNSGHMVPAPPAPPLLAGNMSPRHPSLTELSSPRSGSQSPRKCPDLLLREGRTAYLAAQRKKNAAADTAVAGFRPISRQYGITAHELRPIEPDAKDYRKRCHGLKDTFRAHGVFPQAGM